MFFLVLRKILNNKWLMACLLAGSILAVAMVSSIPLYTGGILQRMLTKDLERYQTDTGYYPGRYLLNLNAYAYYEGDNRVGAFYWFDNRVEPQMAEKLGLPYQEVRRLGMDYMTFLPAVQKEEKPRKTYARLLGITGFQEHVELVAGRMPRAEPVGGVYEVLAAEQAQKTLNILLGEELVLTDETKQIREPMHLKIVGLFRRPATADAWWSEPHSMFDDSFLMDYGLFLREIVQKRNAIVSANWYFAVDYHKLKVEDLPRFIGQLEAQKKFFTQYSGTSWEFPAQKILDQYAKRAIQLRRTLWVLQVPILLMLAFYIFMVSQLIIQNDRNEIAVIRSRGASGFQIFGYYLLQSLVLSGVSVVAGPFVAMLICRMLGAANGFLEFVSRTALPLSMSWRVVQYAVLAGCFSVVTMMIPAIWASRVTIVEHKQKKARRRNALLWIWVVVDVALLGVSLYGRYMYSLRQLTMMIIPLEGVDVPIDPLLFIISTLFVFALGHLVTLAYPFLIRFVSWAGRRFWPPALHTSLVQVGRSGGREQFLMLFLILTISIGVFSANSARTINQNTVDKVCYGNGADIRLQMGWPSNKIEPPPPTGGAPYVPEPVQVQQVITYQEPDFNIYSKLPGTEAAARVFIPDSKVIIYNQSRSSKAGKLMAIVPDEFGRVVWSTQDLLPYHINGYLNLLAKSPNAALVSKALMEDLKLKPGDPVSFYWGKQSELDCVVYGSVEYWPSLNPYREESKYFIVANLSYVQAATSLEPYQIWYKRAPGATTQQIYDGIKSLGMGVEWLKNTEQDVVARKNDPLLQGTNGAMTLGFIVTLAISMIGFFIYWILSIHARTLQFGIFRAMGMSALRVVWMLVFEQAMISGAAIFSGLIVGGLMSDLFVPLLGLVHSAAEQVPPFTVIASRADYIRLYAVVGAMLAAGLALLGVLVRRIKAAQAIKLGED